MVKHACALLAIALFACALRAAAAQSTPAGYLIEAELEPARVYAGAEATLRLRLLRAPGAPFGTLRPPALGGAADLWPLGPIRTYQTERAGAAWQARERTYVIVPRQAGRLVVPGAELEGPLRYAEGSGRNGRPVLAAGALRGPQRVIEVLAPPPEAGEPWVPARRVTLEETWSRDPAALAAGSPVTRTLILRAEGLPADRLPSLEMAAQPALLAHHDLPELATEYLGTGIGGRRVQRVVLMPLAEGEIELPAVSVRWWDVEAGAPRTAVLAGRTLRVGAPVAADAPPRAQPDLSSRAMMRGFAAVILLLSLAALWWHLRTQAPREIRRQLRTACRRNDARGARATLVEWWTLAHPGTPVPLVQRLGEGWDARARAQLGALDAALYARREWDGKAFWRGVRPWLRKRPARRAAPASPALPPLFRLQARGGRSAR